MSAAPLADRIEATARLLRETVEMAGLAISGDGRVGEESAAKLLGISLGGLRNARTEGRGPPWYRRSVGGAKVSYRVADLATYIEEGFGAD